MVTIIDGDIGYSEPVQELQVAWHRVLRTTVYDCVAVAEYPQLVRQQRQNGLICGTLDKDNLTCKEKLATIWVDPVCHVEDVFVIGFWEEIFRALENRRTLLKCVLANNADRAVLLQADE